MLSKITDRILTDIENFEEKFISDMTIHRDSRKIFAERFMDLGNLSFVGLVFSNRVIENGLAFFASLFGMVLVAISYGIGYYLLERNHD